MINPLISNVLLCTLKSTRRVKLKIRQRSKRAVHVTISREKKKRKKLKIFLKFKRSVPSLYLVYFHANIFEALTRIKGKLRDTSLSGAVTKENQQGGNTSAVQFRAKEPELDKCEAGFSQRESKGNRDARGGRITCNINGHRRMDPFTLRNFCHVRFLAAGNILRKGITMEERPAHCSAFYIQRFYPGKIWKQRRSFKRNS